MMDKDEEMSPDPAHIKKEGNPSTSKPEVHHRRRDDDSRSGSGYKSYSQEGSVQDYSSPSRTISSVYSQAVAKADTRPDGPRHMNYGRARPPVKKKKVINKHLVKVEKRKPVPKRKATIRRAQRRLQPLRRVVKAEKAYSYHTVFSRHSDRSLSKESECKHCGHRACRRSESEMSTVTRSKRKYDIVSNRRVVNSRRIERPRRTLRKGMRNYDTSTRKKQISGTQVKSSLILSPLCIDKKTATTEDTDDADAPPYCEIAPEMIHNTLRVLTKWRQAVETEQILAYISRNFPVNKIVAELEQELGDKLRIAAAAGIVKQESEDKWALPEGLLDRDLSNTHVTLFWKLYTDTMQPVSKKEERNFPVNKIVAELEQELGDKLRIAAAAGIVKQESEDKWALPEGLLDRDLSNTHVTLFWKLYTDTMQPVSKKEESTNPKELQDKSQNTPMAGQQYKDPDYVT